MSGHFRLFDRRIDTSVHVEKTVMVEREDDGRRHWHQYQHGQWVEIAIDGIRPLIMGEYPILYTSPDVDSPLFFVWQAD